MMARKIIGKSVGLVMALAITAVTALAPISAATATSTKVYMTPPGCRRYRDLIVQKEDCHIYLDDQRSDDITIDVLKGDCIEYKEGGLAPLDQEVRPIKVGNCVIEYYKSLI